ncbi:MAG TPA: NAD(P)-binding protein, partial [Kofleriaceae bacterium]
MKPRVVVVGAGLCGSVLAALLRDDFDVTVVEQGKKKKPLFKDVDCETGELNTSINRAEGLGGTTNYWHNALIELDDADLRKAGIEPHTMAAYYRKAWQFFLSPSELDDCDRARDANKASLEHGASTVAHMVLPQARHNVWNLANQKNPGTGIDVVYGHAQKIAGDHVELADGRRLTADHVIACAGGLATPVLLAASLGKDDAFVPGYHDHPMAYVAKVKLKPDSRLKQISCTTTRSAEVRAGIIYDSDGLKTVVYLRPAIDMRLGSISGPARYILSDLRNDPFSPKKIMMLLGNLEAVREAILFKTKLGFRGDYFSVLILGEQEPRADRGLKLAPGKKPELDWRVTPGELASYAKGVDKFFAEFEDDILEKKVVPVADWAFRNAAHHSGTARDFVPAQKDAG